MIPPLLLVMAAFFYAGMAWRHFLVHGVQFYGKRGSISSLARNMYLRLVGMALVEATLSAVLIAAAMWDVLSPGLAPIGTISRRLSEVRVRGADAITTNTRMVLKIEWLVTVLQSVVFFSLFALRMEVLRGRWRQIRWLLRLFIRLDVSATYENGTVDQTTTGTHVPTLPTTVVDLSLVIESAGTSIRYAGGDTMDKYLPTTPGSESLHPPCHVDVEDTLEDVVISAIVPEMVPLESPSRASAIASSHNSLSSNFDPEQLVIPQEAAWPRTPTTIPVRFSRPRSRTFSVAYIPDRQQTRQRRLDIDKVDVDMPSALGWVKTPRAYPIMHHG
ncbi:hypothetical protein JVU11DRAFT_8806 [Chiua virens]|nr:hypothetical protein JVU11DRAFT_8806 [Chiua virens]